MDKEFRIWSKAFLLTYNTTKLTKNDLDDFFRQLKTKHGEEIELSVWIEMEFRN